MGLSFLARFLPLKIDDFFAPSFPIFQHFSVLMPPKLQNGLHWKIQVQASRPHGKSHSISPVLLGFGIPNLPAIFHDILAPHPPGPEWFLKFNGKKLNGGKVFQPLLNWWKNDLFFRIPTRSPRVGKKAPGAHRLFSVMFLEPWL